MSNSNSPLDVPVAPDASGNSGIGSAAESTKTEITKTETAQSENTQTEIVGLLADLKDAPRPDSGLPSASELEQTLQRLMRNVARAVQAEKCVFLLHDKERQELVARPPALGFSREQLRDFHIPLTGSIAAHTFMQGLPMMVDAASNSDVLSKPWIAAIDARNLIAYPLVLEHRNEEENRVELQNVGVFLVINKRNQEGFNSDDVAMLAEMARQVTAVIADAQLYLQLTEEKEQLQATLQSLGSGVLMVESTGHVSLVNAAARELFGLKEGEGIGLDYDEVIAQEPIRKLLSDAVTGGHEGGVEIEIESLDNHEPRIYQAQTAFVRGERGGFPEILGVVMIFNDITEIRNVERMKTAFVSTVSHELRTPLTSIKGFVSTLLQDTEGYFNAEARQEFYSIIDTECDRLRRLIDDLLNVSRIESGRALQMNWSLFEPLAIIEKVMQAQRSYTDKHKLILDFSGEVPRMLGDSDKFDQILTNLLSNAIKYSPKGGEVRVIVDLTEDELILRISDQGIGIPRGNIARLFEKFERVDNRDTRQAGGTGIGLFLVKHLTERHEGEIKIESELGKGSTFIVRLPLRPQVALDEMKEHGRESPREGMRDAARELDKDAEKNIGNDS